jgi:hypothetical protein
MQIIARRNLVFFVKPGNGRELAATQGKGSEAYPSLFVALKLK